MPAKGTFKSIVTEASLSLMEEIDLLLRWLGPESTVQATSIRRANAKDPDSALARIWERLDERYGAPELIDSQLRNRITNFPILDLPKDNRSLYTLADILAEVDSIKEDDRYKLLFSYYDTPVGINPIVGKLPENLRNKWRDRAMRYKLKHNVPFPPFKEFVQFIRELSLSFNDPGLAFEAQKTMVRGGNRPTAPRRHTIVASQKTNVQTNNEVFCPLHPHSNSHYLDECKYFLRKTLDDRRSYLAENSICFRCLRSDSHGKKQCRAHIKCDKCNSSYHVTALHAPKPKATQGLGRKGSGGSPSAHGGETDMKEVHSCCTAVCGEGFSGRSCAKTVLVNIHPEGNPGVAITVYAMLDEHCNRTLASSELMDALGVEGNEVMYRMSSCSGEGPTFGRQAHGYVLQSVTSDVSLKLPTLIECRNIPQNASEIPTPEVARHYPHLRHIADEIPQYDPKYHIGLLIGRDLSQAHHVHDQILGPDETPFAQRTCFGWVVIGDVCLDGRLVPEMDSGITVQSFKTYLFQDGRSSIFKPCDKDFRVIEEDLWNQPSDHGIDLFRKRPDDDIAGPSIEDREFLKLMEESMSRDSKGNWIAPLPFRDQRPIMPNNKPLALKRARILDSNLKRNDVKRKHFVTSMEKVLQSGAAEVAPPIPDGKEVWYLPIFGVYHPKKPHQIRGVFDSSALYQGISLNNVLLTGPNMTNSLLGILLRFRKDSIAVSADIEQMFYSFLVCDDHRDYIRFLWYQDNDPDKKLIDYRTCAHVFGNSPSPAVAAFGLRKSVENSDQDIKDFVSSDFYVDDALRSVPSVPEAVDLLQRTQATLRSNGNINLHKFASNSHEVMAAFPDEDLCKELKSLDLDKDSLPVHQSLGLSWNLATDCFIFDVNFRERPNTRRSYLSMLHSVYDPMRFAGPLMVQGKIILRDITSVYDWDDIVDPPFTHRWEAWKDSILSLRNLAIPRMYVTQSLSQCKAVELHVFCDASEQAVAAVSYLRVPTNSRAEVSFAFGKVKLAPFHGHTVPRLELCAALLALEVAETVSTHLKINLVDTRCYSDSRIVLGYINNRTRRFYNYVANRVERNLRSSKPAQWAHVKTTENPADHGTRGLTSSQQLHDEWLTGPKFLHGNLNAASESFPLVDPDQDKEIRIEASKTVIEDLDWLHRYERFSSWKSLVSAIALLKYTARRQKDAPNHDHTLRDESELFLIRTTQEHYFPEEIACLKRKKTST